MQNASAAFLGAARKSMRQIRSALGAAFVDRALLAAAERLQYEGYLRQEEINGEIVARAKRGATIKEIVRETGHSRGLVRKILRDQRSDMFRTRESSLEPHLPWLDAQWTAGNRNGPGLWRRLRASGFRGSLRVVSESFALDDKSALADRELRNALEHFDERLDDCLIQDEAGYFLPMPVVGKHDLADDSQRHIFKLVDPERRICAVLGWKFEFRSIQIETCRILNLARQMDANGSRLIAVAHSHPIIS